MANSFTRTHVIVGVAAALFFSLVLRRRRRRKEIKAPEHNVYPQVVVIFSGKRKSGKDYLCERLMLHLQRLYEAQHQDSRCPAVKLGRLSGPLKKAYADEHNLDFQELLSDGPYKEKYRKDMIAWGEARRKLDPGYFPRLVMAQTRPMPHILIISDARRTSDLAFFRDDHRWKCIAVRVEATDRTRAGRGWKFKEGVDDVESERGLDGRCDWDIIVNNDIGDGSDHIGRIAAEVFGGSSGVMEQVAEFRS